MVLPGVIGYVLFADLIGDNPDATLITLIQQLLPPGLQGLVVAGLLAALMSTVAGALNSTSTLVSIDIVKRLRPQTNDHTLVRIGQVTAVVVMICAIAWSTQGERFGGIFKGINAMIAVLAPPISTVFLWGIFWRRGTSAASLTTLIVGFLLGALVFMVDFPAMSGLILGNDAEGNPIQLVTKQWGIPIMLQAWWLFVICSVVFASTSLVSPRQEPGRLDRFCWGHPLAAIVDKPFDGFLDPRMLSGLLVLVMVLCYLFCA
jgi:SSS family solute:Na+ symporter